jgi:dTDP-4-dehydrorhamnose 3,5-epimerase
MELKWVDEIPGVVVSKCINHVDDRGVLCEILTNEDSFFTNFGQVYMVTNHNQYTVRGFHKHNRLTDWFFIAKGTAQFVLVDDRRGEEENIYRAKEIVIGEKNPSVITVPPGVFHGWRNLVQDTILVSTASERYNKNLPDEERVEWNYFGSDIWITKWK